MYLLGSKGGVLFIYHHKCSNMGFFRVPTLRLCMLPFFKSHCKSVSKTTEDNHILVFSLIFGFWKTSFQKEPLHDLENSKFKNVAQIRAFFNKETYSGVTLTRMSSQFGEQVFSSLQSQPSNKTYSLTRNFLNSNKFCVPRADSSYGDSTVFTISNGRSC